MQFIDLKIQQDRIKSDITSRINSVLESNNFIMGLEVEELEDKLAGFSSSKYCISCSSGTDALLMALMAYGIGKGDAVFTTPFTFVATAEVIKLVGAVPIFVDIDENTWNIDSKLLNKSIDNIKNNTNLKPKMIIPVDIFGLPCDYNKINSIAKKNNLIVLEDAAQSFGAEYNGKRTCSNIADISATSFFPAKPLGCYGDGGAVFTNDINIAKKLRSIRNHGVGEDRYIFDRVGINGRLDSFQATILLSKLEIFEEEIDLRQKVAEYYRQNLKSYIEMQEIPLGYKSAWAQFSFLCDNRDNVMRELKNAGVPTAIYYKIPLHKQSPYINEYDKYCLEISEKISGKIMSIPFYPYLKPDIQDKIIEVIINLTSKSNGIYKNKD